MSNRSYLYAIDFDRTKGERQSGEKIHGLSEFPYAIPLVFKILVSQDAVIAHSINWDYEHPIAIQGNFEKGEQKLYDFLNKLQNENIFNKEELDIQIAATKEFLNSHRLKNIILECGEIYELGDDEIEIQNKEVYEQDILNIDNQIQDFINELKEMKQSLEKLNSEIKAPSKLLGLLTNFNPMDHKAKNQELELKINNIKQSMWDILSINNWSDILYYDFDNDSSTVENK